MLITPTGGLVYHLRALRYRNTRWKAFRLSLHQWLMRWQPPESALLLIGPSGGYCLEPEFVARFNRWSAIDPDPLAARVFPRRMGCHPDWSAEDYFTPRQGRFEIEGFERLLSRYPGHAVLFCNFLGQVPFLNTHAALGESFPLWKQRLPDALRDRSWASFHDRLSGPIAPALSGSREYPREVADSRLVEDLYAAPSGEGLIELSDHLTADLFPGRPRTFFSWELSPGTWHLIEGVHS